MTATQDVRNALYRLSSAIDSSSINAAFLPPEKLQLTDAHLRVVWLLTRLKQNEAYVDQHPGLIAAEQTTDYATDSLLAVNSVGEAPPAIATLFAAIVVDDDLLPLSVQMYQ